MLNGTFSISGGGGSTKAQGSGTHRSEAPMKSVDMDIEVWRRSLRFSDQARHAFCYLGGSWGFRLVREMETLVRFESDSIFVQVFHGRVSCEIGLEVGPLAYEDSETSDLSAIVELHDPDLARSYRRPAVREPDAVGRALQETSEIFRKYGEGAAKGEADVLLRLAEIGRARVTALAMKYKILDARPRAEEAFRRGDYRTVIDAYSSIESVLSPAEKKKLAYARKRCQ